MPFSVITLLVIFLTIALRQTLRIPLKIWHIMSMGAIVLLVTQKTSLTQAWHAIHWNIIIYLFAVFSIGISLEKSGYLAALGQRFLNHEKNKKRLLLIILFMAASGSALLMNDTIAIIGTSLILIITKNDSPLTKPFLLGLAYSITFGSLLTPIGNPQNLLIASSGILSNPFFDFFLHFLVPTIISLLICYVMITTCFRKSFQGAINIKPKDITIDHHLKKWAKTSISLLCLFVLINITLGLLSSTWHIPFALMAIVSAAPLFIFSKKRFNLLKNLDWGSLIFFVALFVVINTVWQTGYFQHLLQSAHLPIESSPAIITISVLLSQLISNVPLVALYLPLLIHAGAGGKALLTLSMGSTLAGNLLIFGAASNIIIIQAAEKRQSHAFSFFEFLKLGLPLTLISLIIYWGFLLL